MFISQAKLAKLQRLQAETQKKTNKKGDILAIYNFAEAVIELDALMQNVTIKKRKEVTKAAEPIALNTYKLFVPKSNKLHKFYVGGKGLKYSILPGNLQRSIKIISDEKQLKKVASAIGPLYKDAGTGAYLASDNKTDGFYAHMVFGSTRAWISKVLNKTIKASQMAVFAKMSEQAIAMAKNYPRKFWEL